MSPARTAILCILLCLVLPGAALAQGAGDQQYTDPFSGQGQGGGGGGAGRQGAGQPSAPSGSTAQAAPAAEAQASPGAGSSAGTAGTTGSGTTLPRTGGDARVIAATGALLLLGGLLLLRLAAAPPASRGPGTGGLLLGRDVLLTRRWPRARR
jgi:hypothetical protein